MYDRWIFAVPKLGYCRWVGKDCDACFYLGNCNSPYCGKHLRCMKPIDHDYPYCSEHEGIGPKVDHCNLHGDILNCPLDCENQIKRLPPSPIASRLRSKT